MHCKQLKWKAVKIQEYCQIVFRFINVNDQIKISDIIRLCAVLELTYRHYC